MNILTYLSKIQQSFPTMTIRPKAILSLICLCASAYLWAQSPPKHSINLVFIGNSITQGALLKDPLHEAPPVRTVEWLNQQPNISEVHYSNQGVSGNTTVDFLPATETCFPKVVAAGTGTSQRTPGILYHVGHQRQRVLRHAGCPCLGTSILHQPEGHHR